MLKSPEKNPLVRFLIILLVTFSLFYYTIPTLFGPLQSALLLLTAILGLLRGDFKNSKCLSICTLLLFLLFYTGIFILIYGKPLLVKQKSFIKFVSDLILFSVSAGLLKVYYKDIRITLYVFAVFLVGITILQLLLFGIWGIQLVFFNSWSAGVTQGRGWLKWLPKCSSLYPYTQTLALILLPIVTFFLYEIMIKKSKTKLPALLSTVLLLQTQVRAPIIGFILSSTGMVSMKLKAKRKMILTITGIVLILTLPLTFYMEPRSFFYRVFLWKTSIENLLSSPVLFLSGTIAKGMDTSHLVGTNPHSLWLWVAERSGFVGLVLFIAVSLITLRTSFRIKSPFFWSLVSLLIALSVRTGYIILPLFWGLSLIGNEQEL